MSNISVDSKDLREIIDALSILGDRILPNTARAVQVSATLIQRTWVEFAQGGRTTGKPANLNYSGDINYANSINIRSISPFHKEIVSDSEVGDRLEKGQPEYDMKPALTSGPKSRVTKDGTRYNIIPFRHKTAKMNAIGKQTGFNLYAAAKSMTQQTVKGTRVDSEGKKRMVYDRWTKDKQLSGKKLPQGLVRRFSGMTRMKTNTAGRNSSIYLTFRTVTLAQQGKWIRKAVPPWRIMDEVIKLTESHVERLISEGIEKDFAI